MFPASGRRRAARTDQLFHAAISAFCALTRPSRAEVAQIGALALSLFDLVSPAAKRFAAAAFSDLPHAPPDLVHRLSEEEIDIAAPLLVRSPVFSDADLVRLIGSHGRAHARAIARRPSLHPALKGLIEVMLRENAVAESATPSGSAEVVRQRLRAVMADAPLSATPATPPAAASASAPRAPFHALRDAAFDPRRPVFEMALAEAAGISALSAARIAADGHDALPRALVSLGLAGEQAFLIVAALHPGSFTTLASVRRFVERFDGGRDRSRPQGEALRRA